MSLILSVTANRTWDKFVNKTDDVLSPAKRAIRIASVIAGGVGPTALETVKVAARVVKLFDTLRSLAEVVPRQVELNLKACSDAIHGNKGAITKDLKELKAVLDAFQRTPLGRSSKDLAQLAYNASLSVSATMGAIGTSPTVVGPIVEGIIAVGAFAKAGEAKANFFADLPALIGDGGASLKSLERLVEAMRKLAVDTAPVAAQCAPDFRANPNR
jgi:ABC-type transporter Mla subunit MlaD